MSTRTTPSVADDLAVAAVTLAGRFAAGSTLWCVSPLWPAHGHHVAVEFVHPVVMGKPALPAVFVEGPDVVGALRLLARPGDAVLVVSAGGDAVSEGLLRRAEAWGLARLWVGAGRRPPIGCADHVVWLDGDPAQVAGSGDIVLLYHLLWELTHVVIEHRGLLEAEPPGTDQVCITCADEGRVAEVRAVLPDGQADVIVEGHRALVDVSLLDRLTPGALVLVHAGVALTTLPEVSA